MSTDQGIGLGRRRVPRRHFETSVGCMVAGQYEIAQSYQVGEGGMMISYSKKLTPGQNMILSFFVVGAVAVIVRGEVRNVVPADASLPERYGIEFVNLAFHFKREIRNFVASATTLDPET